MYRRYNGIQAKVAADNHLAVWIHCDGHSPNIVEQAAAECCQTAVAFFLTSLKQSMWFSQFRHFVMKSLECFVCEKEGSFHVCEKKGKEISGTDDYVQTRNRQRNVRLNPLGY